ncbi:PP2C family protein-serine/threonine phosphatase [Oceanospirillum sanctuarii]|uniref:PP2C family protein-serine/threonine phosphatase n=1 Tax=Oceanospirillum sanctuarii TaxID=1434821 RepID=UPI001594885D|nr:PP2C family serine/threonine-protein phosphatase [Oceanospirillum sanctuarii]
MSYVPLKYHNPYSLDLKADTDGLNGYFDQTNQRPLPRCHPNEPPICRPDYQVGKQEALEVSMGEYSTAGLKALNRDFYGAYLPKEPELTNKGIALALADGINTSQVSHIASEIAVKSFLDDYFATNNDLTVKQAALQVLRSINLWLNSQSRCFDLRFDLTSSYLCGFSAMILKDRYAHLFHVGDSRIYLLREGKLRQLTHDHLLEAAADEHKLSRALGFSNFPDLDVHSLEILPGDLFMLISDGVHPYIDEEVVNRYVTLLPDDLPTVATALVQHALNRGSEDNMTVQLIRVDRMKNRV